MEPNTTPAADQDSGPFITPATPVRLNVRAVVSLIACVVTLVLGSAGGYYALASTDKSLKVEIDKVERRTGTLEDQLKAAPTKADLRELRLQVRMDMLNAIWECNTSSSGTMQCRPRLPRGYAPEEP